MACSQGLGGVMLFTIIVLQPTRMGAITLPVQEKVWNIGSSAMNTSLRVGSMTVMADLAFSTML